MIIEVKELCEVDYINEQDFDDNNSKLAIRTIEYDSNKETLLKAFEDYQSNFDIDKVVDCNDEFDGECQDFITTLSVKELYRIQRKAINIIYDTDGEPAEWLSKEIDIPSYIQDDEIADYISDITGYCIENYTLAYKEVKEDE